MESVAMAAMPNIRVSITRTVHLGKFSQRLLALEARQVRLHALRRCGFESGWFGVHLVSMGNSKVFLAGSFGGIFYVLAPSVLVVNANPTRIAV